MRWLLFSAFVLLRRAKRERGCGGRYWTVQPAKKGSNKERGEWERGEGERGGRGGGEGEREEKGEEEEEEEEEQHNKQSNRTSPNLKTVRRSRLAVDFCGSTCEIIEFNSTN